MYCQNCGQKNTLTIIHDKKQYCENCGDFINYNGVKPEITNSNYKDTIRTVDGENHNENMTPRKRVRWVIVVGWVVVISTAIILLIRTRNEITTFYVQSDNVNIRSCSSVSCKSLGTYIKNTVITFSTPTTFDDLPEWVQISFVDASGATKTGYINKTMLGQNPVPEASEQTKSQNDSSQQQKSSKELTYTEKDLPQIVREWSPRIAHIVCTNDNINYALGSGTFSDLTNNKDNSTYPVLLTNSHVVTSNNHRYLYCDFFLSGNNQPYALDTNNFDYSATQDVEYIITSLSAYLNTNVNLPDVGHMSICSETAAIGDEVIILGFPAAGGTNGIITVTKGIISSYDNQYYVTDAKIDHGNSGGAAILLKDDCYLGIPTWAENGGFESYGRILSESSFLNQK